MSDTLQQALDALVPADDARGDWEDVLARGGARRPPRRRRTLVAALAAAAVALLAAPALAYLLGWIGRHDVTFSKSKPAPNVVKKQFYDLGAGAPPRFAIGVEAGRAREVATFTIHGHPRKLWVAPTRGGGFCFTFEQSFGGCQRAGDRKRFPLSVSWTGATPRTEAPGQVGGTISSARAARIELVYEDGTRADVPFVFVSRPIAAGFFTQDVRRAHWRKGHRLRTVLALDGRGRILARESIPYARAHPRRPVLRGPFPPRAPRALPAQAPPPAPPLQHASADGVSVVAGRNGSVLFDVGRLDRERRTILSRMVSYGCFRITREFGILGTQGVGVEGRLQPRVALRVTRATTPFDGCELSGEAGHRWPDHFASHAPVELALTPAGRRWFADRATARDLALFVRTRRVQQLRKEPPAQALRDLRAAYPALARSAIRIETTPTGLVFSEGRFRVVVSHGRIVKQNVRPYAFVF